MSESDRVQLVLLLLRGVNVAGHKKVPMAKLRELAAAIGLESPKTYIASGNLMGRSEKPLETVRDDLEAALKSEFGFEVDVVPRTAGRWVEYAQGSPFPEAEEQRDNLLHLGVARGPVNSDAAEVLAEYCVKGERVEVIEDGIWIDYPDGVARSKLTPKRIDKAVGSPVTSRNWRSVQKLAALLGDMA